MARANSPRLWTFTGRHVAPGWAAPFAYRGSAEFAGDRAAWLASIETPHGTMIRRGTAIEIADVSLAREAVLAAVCLEIDRAFGRTP